MIIFGAWEILATYRQHWYFDPQAVWDMRIVNLPLEEVLFCAIIPFCPHFFLGIRIGMSKSQPPEVSSARLWPDLRQGCHDFAIFFCSIL
jgi:hypothetical protein